MICDLEPPPLLEDLLKEQQSLRTPVALFADQYESRTPATRFSHLIPLSKPLPGEQYAFEVNLDACTGCKACVAACHSLNGLDDDESWRDTGVLVGTRKQPFLQTVTTACHHCADPACADGCPVLAYDKDSVTGIVRHLDDQCIGCSYCILKCPYDVPKFNLKRGIVRKCDMCQGRLAEGEAPACVQSCPNEAIKISTVKVARISDRGAMVAGAFDSSYTRPATRYISHSPIPPSATPADQARLALDPSHDPLAWMLVLTQMSAGAFAGCAAAMWAGVLTMDQAGITSSVALLVGLVGVGLSVLHLGQPLKAWRAFLGWRKSWLSREIIAFGGLPAGGAAIMGSWWLADADVMRMAVTGAAFVALLAVLCSVMVYADTRRPFWSFRLTAGKFIGTTCLLGAGLCAVTWSWLGNAASAYAMVLALVFRWGLSVWEISRNQQALKDETSAWHKSACILERLLRNRLDLRAYFLVMTGMLIPLAIAGGAPCAGMLTLSLALTFSSQWIERQYFFTAVAGSRMPGN